MNIECYNKYLKSIEIIDEAVEKIDGYYLELRKTLQGEPHHHMNHLFEVSEDKLEVLMEQYDDWLKEKENRLKHEIFLVEIDRESERPFLQFSFSKHGEFDSLYSEMAYLLFEREEVENITESIKQIIFEECEIPSDIVKVNDTEQMKHFYQVIERRLKKMTLFYERIEEVIFVFSNFFEEESRVLKKTYDESMN